MRQQTQNSKNYDDKAKACFAISKYLAKQILTQCPHVLFLLSVLVQQYHIVSKTVWSLGI